MARPKKTDGGETGAEAEAPVSQPEVKAVKKFVSDVQERVMARQAAVKKATEKRKADILEKAKEASKDINVVFVPYKDRNGEIVPALVLGVEDTFKKDKGGQVFDENNEPVMEAKLKVYVFSNIDEPRKTLYNFTEETK
jgi:hypothetical protein